MTRVSIIIPFLLLLSILCITGINIEQAHVIQQERVLIRKMSKNAACMQEIKPTFDGDTYTPVPNGPVHITDN